jgi:hypothetical protein
MTVRYYRNPKNFKGADETVVDADSSRGPQGTSRSASMDRSSALGCGNAGRTWPRSSDRGGCSRSEGDARADRPEVTNLQSTDREELARC